MTENEALCNQIIAALNKQTEALNALANKLDGIHSQLVTLNTRQAHLNRVTNNIRVEATRDTHKAMEKFIAEKQLSFQESLNYVIEKQVSLARFGDGEIFLTYNPNHNTSFQKNSPELQQALSATIEFAVKNPQKLVIGFPNFIFDPHWGALYSLLHKELIEDFDKLPFVLNSHITRPPFFTLFQEKAIQMWRKVWDGKNICIITGKGSRFDESPELFSGVKSIHYVYSAPKNAFEDLPNILTQVSEDNIEAELFLISLGPAGTVLAKDLAARGKWALDIGHISSSMDNVMKNKPMPEKLPVVGNTP